MIPYKKILLVVSAFISFVITPLYSPPLALAAPQNLAPNPSFESGIAQPEGWLGALAGASYTWNSTEAHTGSRSICISNIQANRSVEWDTSPSLPIEAGKTYRIGAWAKGDSDRDASLMAGPLDANGKFLTGQAVLLPYNNTSWTFSERTFVADPNATRVILALGVNNPGGFTSSSVCFDDVIFEEEAALSDVRLITAPVRESVLPFSKEGAEEVLLFHGQISPSLHAISTFSFGICVVGALTGAALLACVGGAAIELVLIEGPRIAAELIAADPPAADFEQVVEFKLIEPFEPTDDSPFAFAWAAVKTSLAEYTALLHAYRLTLERLQGAIAAEEVPFIILQAEALQDFTELLIVNQEELQEALELLAQEFGGLFSAEQQEELALLAVEGLSAEVRQLLENAGATPEEIQAVEDSIDRVPEGVNYDELVQRSVAEWVEFIDGTLPTLREISAILEDVASELNARTPRGPRYWRKHKEMIEHLLPVVLGSEVVDNVKLAKKILQPVKSKDASKLLAANLLATKLNINAASLEAPCILPVVEDAQDFLVQHPRGSRLKAKDEAVRTAREEALGLNEQVDEYNQMSGQCFE